MRGDLTVDSARRLLAERFKSAGIDSAEIDARLLVGEALKLDLTGLITAASRVLSSTAANGPARMLATGVFGVDGWGRVGAAFLATW